MRGKMLAVAAAVFFTATAWSGEIVIGNLQDLSGPTSVFGKAVTQGAELEADRINARGGVNGRKIRLITLDTKGNVQEAIRAFNRLIDHDQVVAVVGPPVSNVGLAVLPIANERKIPVLGSFIDPRVTVQENGKPQPAMFLMQPTSVQFSEILASYTVDVLGLKKIAVFYDQSNAFSVSLIKPFVDYVEAHGGQIVATETFTKNDKDFRAQLGKIKDSGAQAMYAPNYIQDMVLTSKQAKQLDLGMPIIGGLDCAPPFASLVGDPDAADNIYFANNYSDSEPQLIEVRQIYEKKFGGEPTNKVYLGVDKMALLAKAIELGGGATGPQIIDGLGKIRNLPGTTGILTLSPETHQPVGLSLVMYKIEKGKYVELGRHVPESHKTK